MQPDIFCVYNEQFNTDYHVADLIEIQLQIKHSLESPETAAVDKILRINLLLAPFKKRHLS